MIINSLLDTDLYKYTMQQVVFHKFPEATVEYDFSNRTLGADFCPLMGEIQAEIDHLCTLRLTDEQIAYLSGIHYMHPNYVDSLRRLQLDASRVRIECDSGGKFRLRVSGSWYQTILFEVPLLAIIDEVYFRHHVPGGFDSVREEGERRLQEKCRKIRAARDNDGLEIALFEFGTRRRFSRDWQKTVVETLQRETGDSLRGTSNVQLAMELGLAPFGTMAHEFLQACQVFAPLPHFQKYALNIWMQEYRGDLGIALSDVVGSRAFFDDFDKLFSKAYDGCRHDSGDPVAWGEQLIAHYKALGIDPCAKTAVFSDALTTDRMIELARHFQGRIKCAFGIGTHLTNDLGPNPLSIVIKMVRCNGSPVAKLSDSPGKIICDDAAYLTYLQHLFPQSSD